METLWLKGNLHTHSTTSDGDSDAADVIDWYRGAGYDFLALTDHNHLGPEGAAEGGMLLIGSEEVSASASGAPVHVNAFGARSRVLPIIGDDVTRTLAANVAMAHAAGAVTSVNHPNFKWALPLEALMDAAGAPLLEVYNGHPEVQNEGDRKHPGVEALWDACLSNGRWYWGVAVDDEHHLKKTSRSHANPGRAWVVVRARARTTDGVLRALSAGDFYASTGVSLKELVVTPWEVRATIDPGPDGGQYHTQFIGKGGKVLAELEGLTPGYSPKGDEGYVRAKVHGPGGRVAWTQPTAARPHHEKRTTT
jgi:hypothetical protein